MPKTNFPEPPKTGNEEVDQWMLEVHSLILGIGDAIGILDTDNINGELTDTKSHPEFTEVTAYQHHGTGDHNVLDQGDDVDDATASTLSISGTADATYSTNEQDMLNEIKADFNSHITEYNVFVALFNSLKASLKAANLID